MKDFGLTDLLMTLWASFRGLCFLCLYSSYRL